MQFLSCWWSFNIAYLFCTPHPHPKKSISRILFICVKYGIQTIVQCYPIWSRLNSNKCLLQKQFYIFHGFSINEVFYLTVVCLLHSNVLFAGGKINSHVTPSTKWKYKVSNKNALFLLVAIRALFGKRNW